MTSHREPSLTISEWSSFAMSGTTNVYVLRLAEHKCYVGKSRFPVQRVLEHFSRNGSAWTRKYKPLAVEAVYLGCDHFEEDKQTKMLMQRHGIENVRGGVYSSVELSPQTVGFLEKELSGAMDRCFACGGSGHFVVDCPRRLQPTVVPSRQFHHHRHYYDQEDSDEDCEDSSEEESDEDSEDTSDEDSDEDSEDTCYRCSRKGHWAYECYAKYHLDGYRL
jgi:predicted GIY-YIG superfamily endonuclease